MKVMGLKSCIISYKNMKNVLNGFKIIINVLYRLKATVNRVSILSCENIFFAC